MSGGGGRGRASYFPDKPSRLQDLIRQTQEETEQKRLDTNVNEYLQQLLVRLNERNPEKIQEYIDEIAGILGEHQEIERFLFGGSVAKHTFVDGLSDVDALVILEASVEGERGPEEMRQVLYDTLRQNLS